MIPSRINELAHRAGLEARSLSVMARAGLMPVKAPHKLPQLAFQMKKYGPFGGAVAAAAVQHAAYPAIADERGEITYGEFDTQINQLANVFREKYQPGKTVGLLCRNHRTPLLAAFAASRAGLNTVWLNTAFSAKQAAEVATREGVDILICDADLAAAAEDLDIPVIIADITKPEDELTAMVAAGSPTPPPSPAKPGRIIILTSGTTGTPKGAPRTEPKGYTLPGALLDRMPMRSREATVIGPPLFHGTGLIMTMITFGLGSKVVLRRQFDAETFVADIAQHKATALCMVPVLIQRIIALPTEVTSAYDTSSLKAVFCSGSALQAAVSKEFQDRFGDVVYNLYGSTEVSLATMANPDVVRAHPTSVGTPMLGARVAILDDKDRPVTPGDKGRVFVGTVTPFEGYTGGGHKQIVDGMLATGDVGHFEGPLLYIDGRDDDMIVSGGENVFPAEVEELLISHPAVREVAVVGVEDSNFGQRLRAFIALNEGASLSEDEVRDLVKENLARYKVPRDVFFLDNLPRNPTGKVLKRELVTWE
ncbi:fatty-acyl-CoA synthase [Nocardioides baekrokdamisoli]|uniref:Fatty-acyl-CoA synthase n=1 Tax=Nocardioides baekrokdamisoli TaxID=1804624 RepID=A0A3G9J3N3_9ACTN|nr:AMP-binding protein [Nocardioides baekrokdamisoli]BBH17619.1 fatty-acyl-CoA synthase [Nocardioides baekrokdamisoli]